MGGQAAEQIIAGVVLSERLAVTMYGAIHRASFNGQRNLRGLIVDPKFLEDTAFRNTVMDTVLVESVAALTHANVVPTFTVESGGPDVVVVTRGVGRYVTVQDLITASRARAKGGGKLSIPVAGLIGRSVIEALAAAHQAGVIHGAVHPRSVLIDEDGGVRVGDFVVGRALTTAVAAGADSALWRGLAGYIAPELVVGEDPTPGADVYAVGAMLFTMLSGEVPPGTLRVTPAVERLVQRALDTDPKRRYKTAIELLENLIEAMEDDRWELADKAELIREAGLSAADQNIDDATEDLLASLGSSAMQVTPTRPSMDLRAEQSISRQSSPGVQQTGGRLDALLADLGGPDHTNVTQIDDEPYRRDPISELIALDPRKREAIVSTSRVPSLDDPDDSTPLPPPQSHSDYDTGRRSGRAQSSAARASSADEAAALAAIGDLDEGARRMSGIGDQAAIAAMKLEEAAARAERAAVTLETRGQKKIEVRRAPPIADPLPEIDAPSMRVKSRMGGVLGIVVILIAIGAAYMIYKQFTKQEDLDAAAKKQKEDDKAEYDKKTREAIEDLPDPGSIKVTSNPPQAGVWLKIGRTPVDSIPLSSAQMHELRVEGVDGYDPVDTQVVATHWTGDKTQKKALKAAITVVLKPAAKDKTGKAEPVKLPVMPPKPPDATGFIPGRGPIHVESTPPGAEVWMFIGMTNNVELSGIRAGMPYELRVLADGYLPGYISVTGDEWRDGGDPNVPIDRAKKKPTLEKNVDLVADPNAVKKDDPKHKSGERPA
ncbi:MAG TPA: protein kinase, partial [Kofleriaceae bacterium]|nr:protein kinase [Kofleriaceae bacterium]